MNPGEPPADRQPRPAGQAGQAGASNVPEPRAGSGAPRRFDSTALFAGAQEVEIVHDDAIYRLRRTALGKLILTK